VLLLFKFDCGGIVSCLRGLIACPENESCFASLRLCAFAGKFVWRIEYSASVKAFPAKAQRRKVFSEFGTLVGLLAIALRDHNLARLVTVTRNGDAPYIRGQVIVAQAFGPFDDDNRLFVGQQFIEVDSVRRACSFAQAIEIDVIEPQARIIWIDERERRAGNFFRVDSEAVGQTLDKHRLARAERSTEQENLAAGKLAANARAEGKSLCG
jgi:hypothetical protein